MEILPNYITGIVVLLLFSSFVKIATTLSIVRFGIGLTGAGFGAAILALSLALSFLVLQPVVEKAGGVDTFFSATALGDFSSVEKNFRPFLSQQVDKKVLRRLELFSQRVSKKQVKAEVASQDKEKASPSKSEVRFSVLAAAFLITELKVAFQLGFIILIPFLVIDLLVANALLVLGAQQFSHSVVSVPLKILLFFVMDGWLLVSQRLLGTYVQG